MESGSWGELDELNLEMPGYHSNLQSINYYTYILMIITLIACKGKQKDSDLTPVANRADTVSYTSDVNAYEDIDIFNLHGVTKMNQRVSFPYVRIERLGKDKINVTFMRSKNDSAAAMYQKKDGYWLNSYKFRADTGYINVYRFISPKRIVEVVYSADYLQQGWHLIDVMLHEKGRIVSYVLEDKTFNPLPDPTLLEQRRGMAIRTLTTEYQTENELFIICDEYYDNETKTAYYKDKTAYRIGNRSHEWWQNFYDPQSGKDLPVN